MNGLDLSLSLTRDRTVGIYMVGYGMYPFYFYKSWAEQSNMFLCLVSYLIRLDLYFSPVNVLYRLLRFFVCCLAGFCALMGVLYGGVAFDS